MTNEPAAESSWERTNVDRIRAFLVLAATAGTILFNWLAATGYLGGVMTGEISDRHPTVITPAGYAFSIWSLIYVGLVVFSIMQMMPSNEPFVRRVRSLYILSCALNCAWLFFWHQEQIAVCAVLIWALAFTLFQINRKLAAPARSGVEILMKAVFGIYLGWLAVATLVNTLMLEPVAARLAGNAEVVGAAVILLAAGFGVALRIYLQNYFAPLSIAWGLTAVAVQQSGKTAIVSAAAVGVIACLIASLTFVLNLKSSTDE